MNHAHDDDQGASWQIDADDEGLGDLLDAVFPARVVVWCICMVFALAAISGAYAAWQKFGR